MRKNNMTPHARLKKQLVDAMFFAKLNLNTEEAGAFFNLLMNVLWHKEEWIYDHKNLHFDTTGDVRSWKRIRPKVIGFFDVSDGKISIKK
jgi:uncharacterized protein YdaU (DUF1376 family)